MHKEALTKFGSQMTWLPITALIIFAICFSAFTYWTLRKDNKKRYEEAGSLPLNDGVTNE
jgi:cbb3-type cytochrome oxidase subunit 3